MTERLRRRIPCLIDDGNGGFELERLDLCEDAVEQGQHLGV
jgi:hypothetical protein